MTTLERIEQIRKESFGCPTCEGGIPYLLHAFDVMRGIAIRVMEDEIPRPTLVAYKDIDEEFEKRLMEDGRV